MEEEDEDRLMLSSLGITSANQEDLERKLISEANSTATGGSESEENHEDLEPDREHEAEPSSTTRVKLYNELRTVEVEINAVASTIKKARSVGEVENGSSGDTDIMNDDDKSAADSAQIIANGLALQQALAKDRLGSLKRKKAQLQKEISNFDANIPADEISSTRFLNDSVEDETEKKQRLKAAKQSVKDSKQRRKTVAYGEDADFDAVLDAASAGFVETERDELVRKGILTPFHKLKGFERRVQQPGPSNRQNDPEEVLTENIATTSFAKVAQSMSDIARSRPTTKLLDANDLPRLEAPTRPFQRLKTPLKRPVSPISEDLKKKQKLRKTKRPLPDKKWRKANVRKEKLSNGSDVDARGDSITSDYEEELQDEMENAPDQEQCSVVLEGGLRIPDAIYTQLFDYQKVGVQWLWELHCQRAGGIIGDEMGLGKTVQVLSFLGALHFSDMYKPSIIICPVTLLQQWQREAQKWYPQFTVEILHDSARGLSKKKKPIEHDYDTEASSDSDIKRRPAKSTKRWDDLIDHVVRSESGLLLTTYEQLRILGGKLLDIEWGYAILDEGHRIRNPNAEVTLVCKQLQTVHRIIMTGAPIQNKLTELWSLFDFVFPGKLGVLPVFEKEFAVPISIGGYANASPLQVSTAFRCAVVLRDLIMPYLLRRMKADVNAQLTKKTEHVLFCSLTPDQRSAYRAFLASSEVEQIFDGRLKSLYGIDVMRKICNHPDLLEREHSAQNPDYGNPERSGKMKVIAQVLKVWNEQGHRVLLFAQTQQMLDILENFLITSGYNYRRMDGSTPVRLRMALIDEFNNSGDIFVFILTTKVGGLGTNLIGANRVIIYDPDWNPSTDMQARERAWRIGQRKDVTVYRLVTRGTIEEKVYHRQIYKHFLTNKILKNPQQRRFFKARDMRDLFYLQDDKESDSTETSNIFSQLSDEINVGVYNGNQDNQKFSSVASTSPVPLHKETSTSGFKTSMPGGEEENATQENREVDEEANILKSLFNAQGIHSAMNHDAIMNANDSDKMRMEEEASKVAQRAAEALRESRALRSRESFAVPTWTGRSGAAGAPSSLRRKFGSNTNTLLHASAKLTGSSSSKPPTFAAGVSTGKALSSAELLARIQRTQTSAANDGLEQELSVASSSNQGPRIPDNNRASKLPRKIMQVQPEVLIRQLCSFIQHRGGFTDSATITQHFKDRIRSEDLSLFKNLLKAIATLEKDANGSRWKLKPDYR